MATKKMAFSGMGPKISSAVKTAATRAAAAPKPTYSKPSASDQQAAMAKVQATKAAAQANRAAATPPASMGNISRAIASAKNTPSAPGMKGSRFGGMGMKKGGKAKKK